MSAQEAEDVISDWRDASLSNRRIAALVLGRAYNEIRFDLLNAFLLYSGYVDTSALYQLDMAVSVVEELNKRKKQFADNNWPDFACDLDKIREILKSKFGRHDMEDFRENLDQRVTFVAEYGTLADKRDYENSAYWLGVILQQFDLWDEDIHNRLRKYVNEVDMPCFNLGLALDQSIRPPQTKSKSGKLDFVKDNLSMPDDCDTMLLHRFGNIACEAGDDPFEESWFAKFTETLEPFGLESIVSTIRDHGSESKGQRRLAIEQAFKQICRVLEAQVQNKETKNANAAHDMPSRSDNIVPSTGKKSTLRGEADTKLSAALVAFHKYDNGSCLEWGPVGCNDLARMAQVAQSSASKFFGAHFDGYSKYKSSCNRRDNGLITKLMDLNGEFPQNNFCKPSGTLNNIADLSA